MDWTPWSDNGDAPPEIPGGIPPLTPTHKPASTRVATDPTATLTTEAKGDATDIAPASVPIVARRPTATPTRLPTPAVVPAFRHLGLKQHMLDLINQDRADYGLEPVALGDNSSAQRHAEDMLEYGYSSHWSSSGLKPYMRYSLNGGTGMSAENISGRKCPLSPSVRYRTTDHETSVEETHTGLMQSPGHRRNILNPWHTIVHLGLACDDVGCAIVQLFDRDYLSYSNLPSISEDGVLTFTAEFAGGFELSGIQVWYDELPHVLTFGQLGATHSYSVGQQAVASIRPPLEQGWHYEEDSFTRARELPQDPYKIHPEAERPFRVDRGNIEECVTPPKVTTQVEETVPWVTADAWEVSDGETFVSADVYPAVADFRPGVYTVLVWADHTLGESVPVSEHSIFVE